MIIYTSYWVYSGAYIYSIGTFKHNPKYPFGTVEWGEYTRYMVYAKIFSLLWVIAFFHYACQFVLITVASIWYFAVDRNDLGSPVLTGIGWAFGKHMGTLAFGSFVLALVWTLQIILSYLYKKAKEIDGKNGFFSYIIGCIQCFVLCFERIIKYISKHAFVETVLRSSGFCAASVKAFGIITSHILSFGILSGMTELFMLFGTFAISATSTTIGFFLLKIWTSYFGTVFETFAPLVVRITYF